MLKDKIKTGFKEDFLIPANMSGILDGLTFSVKDVFNIQGHRTSFGSPLWGQTHPIATENAICVQQLLMNGGSCLGSAMTGELGCGSTGVNHFFGTPLNPKAPSLVPGGSSSGSASSVAAGLVDFSLGTDAGGSVRVPASFCGVLGMRPSQGIISTAGVTTLVPSFDTVGVFANTMEVLTRVMSVLLGIEQKNTNKVGEVFIIEDLMTVCSKDTNEAMKIFSKACKKEFKKDPIVIKLKDIDSTAGHADLGIANTFLHILCGEIWTSISAWANEVKLEFGKNTYVDFTFMQNLDKTKISLAFSKREYLFEKINQILSPNNLFCIPTTPFSAILRSESKKKINEFDYEKLRPLVSLASIGRLPQINLPILNQVKAPIGISLIAGFKKDNYLIDTAKKVYDSLLRANR
jgi:amidase